MWQIKWCTGYSQVGFKNIVKHFFTLLPGLFGLVSCACRTSCRMWGRASCSTDCRLNVVYGVLQCAHCMLGHAVSVTLTCFTDESSCHLFSFAQIKYSTQSPRKLSINSFMYLCFKHPNIMTICCERNILQAWMYCTEVYTRKLDSIIARKQG